jgi:hypothetical protein
MTGGRGNVSATFLNLAREIAHDLGDADLVTGLATMTRMGAPDWRAELSAVAGDFPDAEVFFLRATRARTHRPRRRFRARARVPSGAVLRAARAFGLLRKLGVEDAARAVGAGRR